MKLIRNAALLGLLLSSVAPAQDIEKRGREIIDQAIQALGGEKFLTYQNRVETGRLYSFSYSQLKGLSPATIYTRILDSAEVPDPGTKLALQERQAFNKPGKPEDYYSILRPEGAWEVTYRGRTLLPDEDVERMRETRINNIFYILRLRMKEPGLIFEYHGADVMENIPVFVVDVIDSQNRVVRAYFHQTSHLPVRQDWSWRDTKTHEKNDEITRFSRYRDSEGIQWPQQIYRERNGYKIFEQFSEKVEFNAELDDSVFAVPDAKSKKK